MRNSKPVLLIEDDSVDAMTVRRAFKELKVRNELVRMADGEQALAYLKDATGPKPCVILLDLNMPRMGGIEFLTAAKRDEDLRKIPVVVLTTSKDDRDKVDSFKLSVAGYIVKPVDYKKFVEAMRILDLYWTLSELPDQDGAPVPAVQVEADDATQT